MSIVVWFYPCCSIGCKETNHSENAAGDVTMHWFIFPVVWSTYSDSTFNSLLSAQLKFPPNFRFQWPSQRLPCKNENAQMRSTIRFQSCLTLNLRWAFPKCGFGGWLCSDGCPLFWYLDVNKRQIGCRCLDSVEYFTLLFSLSGGCSRNSLLMCLKLKPFRRLWNVARREPINRMGLNLLGWMPQRTFGSQP